MIKVPYLYRLTMRKRIIRRVGRGLFAISRNFQFCLSLQFIRFTKISLILPELRILNPDLRVELDKNNSWVLFKFFKSRYRIVKGSYIINKIILKDELFKSEMQTRIGSMLNEYTNSVFIRKMAC